MCSSGRILPASCQCASQSPHIMQGQSPAEATLMTMSLFCVQKVMGGIGNFQGKRHAMEKIPLMLSMVSVAPTTLQGYIQVRQMCGSGLIVSILPPHCLHLLAWQVPRERLCEHCCHHCCLESPSIYDCILCAASRSSMVGSWQLLMSWILRAEGEVLSSRRGGMADAGHHSFQAEASPEEAA